MEQVLPPIQEERWLGMHHDESAALEPGVALFIQNFYTEDGTLLHRPGTDQLGSQLAASKIQGIKNFEELDGTVHILAFCNGDMFEYDEGTGTWSQTDLSSEGVTMDPSSRLDFTNSRGRLIVTDGVNQPWMWDGTDFTVLSNAPIARGVTVYYDKVFFFDISGEEVKFEWSDEGDPVNGYDADGQSWEFVQTDSGRVRGMASLNNTLVVGKQDSIAQLRGAVNDQFQTDAVREGVSETLGPINNHCVVVEDGDVFLLTQDGPRMVRSGQALVDIRLDENGDDRVADTWDSVDRSNWTNAIGVLDSVRSHIWWAIPDDGFVIIYSIDDNSWQRFEFPWRIEALEEVEFTTGEEYVLIGDDDGNVYRYGVADTLEDAGSTAIEFILRSRLHGSEQKNNFKRLAEVHLTLDLVSDLDGFNVNANVDGDVQTDGVPITISGETGRKRFRVGLNSVGTGVGWEFRHQEVGEAVSIESALTIMTLVGSYSDF